MINIWISGLDKVEIKKKEKKFTKEPTYVKITKNSVVYWGDVAASKYPGSVPHFLLVTQVLGSPVE